MKRNLLLLLNDLVHFTRSGNKLLSSKMCECNRCMQHKKRKSIHYFFCNNTYNNDREFVKGKLKFRSIFDVIFAACRLHTNSMNDYFSWTRLKNKKQICDPFECSNFKSKCIIITSNEHVFSWSMVDELKACPK